MKKTKIRFWAVAFWLLVWQGGSMLLKLAYPNGQLLLVSPLSALHRLFELTKSADFWRSVFWTGGRIFGGFLSAAFFAVIFAACAARYRFVRELLAPVVAAVKAVPVASFIILALVWLNSSSLSFFISALMVFPPIYLNTLEGIRQTDAQLLEMAQVFRVPRREKLRGIYLPQVLPYFCSAASAALGLCWKAGIAAEVIGLPTGSIGERLYTAKVHFETPELFAWTVVVVALSALLERMVMWLLDRLAGKAANGWN